MAQTIASPMVRKKRIAPLRAPPKTKPSIPKNAAPSVAIKIVRPTAPIIAAMNPARNPLPAPLAISPARNPAINDPTIGNHPRNINKMNPTITAVAKLPFCGKGRGRVIAAPEVGYENWLEVRL
jgi:hypothetical protein